jgi:hypothetical protein
VEVPACEFKWFCPRITKSSYSIDKFNPHVKILYLESSTLALEWTFDLLHSVNKVFPSIKHVHLRFYHVPQMSNELLPCFTQQYSEDADFNGFATNLKTDQLELSGFVSGFTTFISGRLANIEFSVDIVWPVEGCNLVGNLVS